MQHAADPLPLFCPRFTGAAVGRLHPSVVSCQSSGRDGDFQPDVEVSTVRGRQKAKQARRLQTFCQGLVKAVRVELWVTQQLLRSSSTSFTGPRLLPFLRGMDARVACVGFPGLDFVRDLTEYVKHDARVMADWEFRQRQKKYQLRLDLDSRHGHLRPGFAGVRGPVRRSRTQLRCMLEVPWMLHWTV